MFQISFLAVDFPMQLVGLVTCLVLEMGVVPAANLEAPPGVGASKTPYATKLDRRVMGGGSSGVSRKTYSLDF
jgi:hypothetical protein